MFPDLTRDDVFLIETRRLWLRWPRARDVDAILRFAGSSAVAAMTGTIPHPLDRTGTERFVLEARTANAEGAGLTLGLCRREDPANLVGLVGITRDEGEADLHIGYWLGQPYWGAGLTTEAASALIEAYFAYAGGRTLLGSARTDNVASRRVLTKCGFEPTGRTRRFFPVRGVEMEMDLFRLDRPSWSHGRTVPRPRAETNGAE